MEIEKQLEIIKRGTVELISEEELIGKLKKKPKRLIIKAGFDPTVPDIHLGHTVLLRKLKHFQNIGHKVIFLIGDATALVGDPSGQSQTRKTLTWEEVQDNARTYKEQVSKILKTDKEAFELKHNSSWFPGVSFKGTPTAKFDFDTFTKLARKYTVARLLEKDEFQKRAKENKPISFLELFYPVMQGYDSVMLNADVEIGGTDQKFNMLVGRDLQQAYGQEPQVVITMPLLVGIDGVQKMSKSYGNYIGINESAKEIFGKLMSISDDSMYNYYELLTDEDLQQIKTMHPMEAKKNLAYLIVKYYHGEAEAAIEKKNFEEVFQKGKDPEDAPVKKFSGGPYSLNQVFDRAREEFRDMGIDSRTKLLQKLEEGAIKIDGKKINDANYQYFQSNGRYLLKIGRHFLNVDLT